MAEYVPPALSFDAAVRQLQTAHHLELLHAKSCGCQSLRLPPQLPSGYHEENLTISSRMLMATSERVHAKNIGDGLEELAEFMEVLPIRHMEQALRQLPRVPPKPSDELDSECLDAGKFPESQEIFLLSRTTEGTAKTNASAHTAGTSDTLCQRTDGINFSIDTSTPVSNMLAQDSASQSTELVACDGHHVSFRESVASPMASCLTTTSRDPLARWAALMKKVASELDTVSEVHRTWEAGRPQDLGQALGVSPSCDNDNTPTKETLKRRHCTLNAVSTGGQRTTTMVYLGKVATAGVSRIFSDRSGTETHCFWALHPNSKTRLVWDLAGLVFCLFDLTTFPMQMVRLINEIAVVAICLTMYWTLDIFMSCISGFFTKDGLIEMRMEQVVKRYVRTWLVLDVGLCAFDWISRFVEMTGAGTLGFLKSFFRFIRIVRVLRLLKLIPKLQANLGQINSEFTFTWLRLLLYICCVVMINHYIACLFCSVWSQLADPSKQYRYASALHWALAHCLLGSMDVTPCNVGERILTCSVLVISMVVFATLLSNITQNTSNLQALSAERSKRESGVRRFFSENSIPPELVARVWHVIRRNDLASGGKLKEDTVEIFNMLPQYLKKEIRYATFRPLLVNHPFFDFYDVIEPRAVRMLCSLGVQQMRVLPYEQLAWPSATGANLMLFVVKGELDYYPTELPCVKLRCPAGRWALEETLWARHAIVQGPLTSGSEPCELMLMVPREFHDIARINSDTMHALRIYARVFVRKFNEACLIFEETNLLFNSDATINEILEEVRDQCEVREALLPSIRKHHRFYSGFAADHHVNGFVHERRRAIVGRDMYEPP